MSALPGWFIVELMGHRRLAGRVTEHTMAGVGFLRIDVPGPAAEPAATQFFLPASIYALTPTTEEMAHRVAASCRIEPVKEWELPPRPALAASTASRPEQDGEEDLYDCPTHGLQDRGHCSRCYPS